jgi:lipopolysaccharide export system permease protein
VALSSPVFLLSVLASALAAYINMQVAPQCRTAYRFLIYQVGVEKATSFIVEGRWMDGFDNYVIYVGRKNGNELERVLIYELSEEGRIRQKLQAARAELRADPENFEASLRLYDVDYFNYETWLPGSAAEMEGFKLSYRPPGQDDLDLPISDMTFRQLWRKLNDLEAFAASAAPVDPRDGVAREEHDRKVNELRNELTQQVRVQMHRQVAFSFACIGFTLVGIPLGVRAHRRETSVGFAMALLLVALYYAFIVLAQSLQDRPEFGPHLILWLPNFIFQVVGVALLWRANRGF